MLRKPQNGSSHCPLCRDTQFEVFDRRKWHEYNLVNLICPRCGLVFQGGDTPAHQQEFYVSNYRRLYQGTEKPTPKDLAIQGARAAHLVTFLAQNRVREVHRHVDIGSSSGIFLNAVQAVYQNAPVGVEISRAYRNHARDKGLCIYAEYEQMVAAESEPFDLVSLIHTLEHIPDPLDYLIDLRQKIITPQGYLLLEVPNLFAHDCFELGHLTHFSAHTLREMVQQAGFKVLRLIRHGKPRSRTTPLYLLLLGRPKSDGDPAYRIHPDRLVRLKRRLGLLRRRFWERTLPGQAWLPIPEM